MVFGGITLLGGERALRRFAQMSFPRSEVIGVPSGLLLCLYACLAMRFTQRKAKSNRSPTALISRCGWFVAQPDLTRNGATSVLAVNRPEPFITRQRAVGHIRVVRRRADRRPRGRRREPERQRPTQQRRDDPDRGAQRRPCLRHPPCTWSRTCPVRRAALRRFAPMTDHAGQAPQGHDHDTKTKGNLTHGGESSRTDRHWGNRAQETWLWLSNPQNKMDLPKDLAGRVLTIRARGGNGTFVH